MKLPRINRESHWAINIQTGSCSSKACLLWLKGAYLKLKGFWSSRHCHNTGRGFRGQKATGRRYRPCFWKVIALLMGLGSWLLFSPYVLLWLKLNASVWAGKDKHQRAHSTPYQTLPWPRFGLREHIPPRLKDLRLSSETLDKSFCQQKLFNLIAV